MTRKEGRRTKQQINKWVETPTILIFKDTPWNCFNVSFNLQWTLTLYHDCVPLDMTCAASSKTMQNEMKPTFCKPWNNSSNLRRHEKCSSTNFILCFKPQAQPFLCTNIYGACKLTVTCDFRCKWCKLIKIFKFWKVLSAVKFSWLIVQIFKCVNPCSCHPEKTRWERFAQVPLNLNWSSARIMKDVLKLKESGGGSPIWSG